MTNVDLQLQNGIIFWMQGLTNVNFRIQRGFMSRFVGRKNELKQLFELTQKGERGCDGTGLFCIHGRCVTIVKSTGMTLFIGPLHA